MEQNDLYRSIPKVDMLLELSEIQELLQEYDKILVLEAIRAETEKLRNRIAEGLEESRMLEEVTRLPLTVRKRTRKLAEEGIKRVVNATGTILHTNLGRAPISADHAERLVKVLTGYSNLEYSLEEGARGERCAHFEKWICRITGAEAAIAVNNNAAAVMLALAALASGKEVVVSRGELIEIGGKFRIPDVMEQSGVILKEVGTTNRTRLADYEKAVAWNTGAILKVHTSNYRIVGFTESTTVQELSVIGEKQGVPVVVDLGSGVLLGIEEYGLSHEPTVQEAVAAGADVICFSGDKLLGGPQAGIIVGKRRFVDRLKQHPLMRALRVDKFTAAILEYTFREYLRQSDASYHIPVLRMMGRPLKELQKMAENLVGSLKAVSGDYVIQTEDSQAQMGGGSLPGEYLPSKCVTILPKKEPVSELEARLRECACPIIGRIAEGHLILDMRTILEEDFSVLSEELAKVLQDGGQ